MLGGSVSEKENQRENWAVVSKLSTRPPEGASRYVLPSQTLGAAGGAPPSPPAPACAPPTWAMPASPALAAPPWPAVARPPSPPPSGSDATPPSPPSG